MAFRWMISKETMCVTPIIVVLNLKHYGHLMIVCTLVTIPYPQYPILPFVPSRIGLESCVFTLDNSLQCCESTYTLSSSACCTFEPLDGFTFRDSANIWKYA